VSGEAYDATYERRAAAGEDVHGEASFVERFAPEVVLDAGCGTGRVGRELARRGCTVVGVDIDEEMLATARGKAPDVDWRLADLSSVDLEQSFDAIVLAGNVMIFLTPGTESAVVANLARHLRPGGVVIAGFQVMPRRLTVEQYDEMADDAGLELAERWSTWDRDPWHVASDYAVSVHRRPGVAALAPGVGRPVSAAQAVVEERRMTGGGTSIVRGDGGLEIPVEWVYPGAEAHEWLRDTEHWPAPMPPLELWLHRHGVAGADRAWEEAGMEAPAVFYRFQYAGPFLYARESPYEPERMMRNVLRYREVSREHGGAERFWLEFCRPRIVRVCRELAEWDDRAGLLALGERWAYAFHQTFTSLAPMFEPGMALNTVLEEIFGEEAPLVALEVLQGGENATQAIDAEIWELAELARRTPAVERLIADAGGDGALASLREEPDAGVFIAAFDALIGRHGSRAQGWELVMPTWREPTRGAARADPGATGDRERFASRGGGGERSAEARREATGRGAPVRREARGVLEDRAAPGRVRARPGGPGVLADGAGRRGARRAAPDRRGPRGAGRDRTRGRYVLSRAGGHGGRPSGRTAGAGDGAEGGMGAVA